MDEMIRIYNIEEIIEVLGQDEERIFKHDSDRRSSYIKNAKYRKLEKVIGWCDKKDERHTENPLMISEETRNMEFIDVTPVQLSEDEKVILRNFPKEYKWITRDADGDLSIYDPKPFKNEVVWHESQEDGEFGYLRTFNHLFQQIQWSDKEPTLIADLL